MKERRSGLRTCASSQHFRICLRLGQNERQPFFFPRISQRFSRHRGHLDLLTKAHRLHTYPHGRNQRAGEGRRRNSHSRQLNRRAATLSVVSHILSSLIYLSHSYVRQNPQVDEVERGCLQASPEPQEVDRPRRQAFCAAVVPGHLFYPRFGVDGRRGETSRSPCCQVPPRSESIYIRLGCNLQTQATQHEFSRD